MKIQSGRLFGWLTVCMLCVAAIVPIGRDNKAINANSQLHTVSNAPDAVANRYTFKAIDQLQVGQRVLTGFDSDSDRHTAVDSSTWKKLSLTAEYAWTDGTRDTFQVETLQSPTWLDLYSVSVGAQVPMPLDVQEMGCPDGLMATVESIEPCPPLQDSPGRVILTTVSHLNAACRALTVRDEAGHTDTIQTTDYHPFWSASRTDWVKANQLTLGERLVGENNRELTLISTTVIQGKHVVHNLSVETKHRFRVGYLQTLTHNNDCKVIYRKGSATNTNMTPRPELDEKGLSTALAPPPSGKYQIIDPAKLNDLEAVVDGADHASVRPIDMSKMQGWMDSRANADLNPHPLTLELQNAVIGTGGKK